MKKKHSKAKKASIFPLFIVFAVLLVGIAAAIFQTTQQQNTQSRAQMNFDPNMPPQNCPNTPAELQNSANETAMVTAINEYRRQNNQPPVEANAQLKKAAKWYSKDLAANPMQMGNGTDSVGRNLEPRLIQCVVDLSGEFTENIGFGPTAADVLNAMKADTGANTNLLNPRADFVAVGNTGDSWVIDFAQPPGTPQAPMVPGVPQTPQPQQPNVSTAPQAPGQPFPSAACLGSCPTTPPDGTGGTGNDAEPTPCPVTTFENNDVQNTYDDDGKKKGGHKKGSKGGGTNGGGGNTHNGLLEQLIKLLEQLLVLLGGTPPPPSSGTSPETGTPTTPC